MKTIISALALATTLALIQTSNAWNWGEAKDAPPPPDIQPFQLPKFDGSAASVHEYIPPLIHSPRIDADAIYNATVNCFPAPTKWNIDVDLQAGVRTNGAQGLEDSEIGGHYVGLVARMPLYSATELERARKNEYDRRQDAAKLVGAMIEAIAKRNSAQRELGLYSALESRAQVRVQKGITTADEQVGYMEKVIRAHEEIILHEAGITQARLALVGSCRPQVQATVDEYLRKISELPRHPCNTLMFKGTATEYQQCFESNGASLKSTGEIKLQQ